MRVCQFHHPGKETHVLLHQLARLEGFEPPTIGSEVRCSIQLSHKRKWGG